MRLTTLLFHDLYTREPSESGFTGPGADRYKLKLEDFDGQLQSIARESNRCPVLITRGEDVHHAAGKVYAITVDDGGLSYYSLLADRLEERGWRGHCLVTTGCLGRRGFLHPGQVRELQERGHVIGSHTVTHPAWFNRCNWKKQVEEWRKSKETLEDITGQAIYVGSVPGGYYSGIVSRSARAAGLEVLFTSEPEMRVHATPGCKVIGRYTLRRDSPPGLAGLLVRQEPAALLREWLSWNGKKVLKTSLGPGYQWLSARLG